RLIVVTRVGGRWAYADDSAHQARAGSGPPWGIALPRRRHRLPDARSERRRFRGDARRAAMFKTSAKRIDPAAYPSPPASENFRYSHLNVLSLLICHSNNHDNHPDYGRRFFKGEYA